MAAMPQAVPMTSVEPMIRLRGLVRVMSQEAAMKPISFVAVYPTSSQANSSGVAWVSPMISLRPSDRTVLAIASVKVVSTMPATRILPAARLSWPGLASMIAVMCRFPIDLDTRGQAGHDAAGQWIAGKADFHRHALNDTNEVPCRIVGGEQS